MARRSIAARLAAALLAAGALTSACASDGPTGSPDAVTEDPVDVVVTTGIWGDIVNRVLCEGSATVRLIMPSGTDPHDFEPSLADRETLGRARIVVSNGAGLEGGLADTLETVAAEGVDVVAMSDLVDTLEAGDTVDPHVWLDPTRVAASLEPLAARLTAALDLDPGALDACVEAYGTELTALDAEVAALLAEVPEPRRGLVTQHASMAYFADRYGFDVVGSVVGSSSSLSEANPADLEELAERAEARGVAAVFSEAGDDDADAAALADALGVDVVALTLESLGPPGSGAADYLELVRSAAGAIAAALE